MSFSKSELTKLLEACDRLSNEEKEKLLKHLIGKDASLSILFDICDCLSNEEKRKLLKYLIGRDNDLFIAIGSSPFNAKTVYQINISDKEKVKDQVSDVLRVLAGIIEEDNTDFES